jgi:hypothetical protein
MGFVENYVQQGPDSVGRADLIHRYDPGLMRPYFDSAGRRCVTMNSGKYDNEGKPIPVKVTVDQLLRRGITSPVLNATTLRKEEWLEFDRVVLKAYRLRLRAWADLRASNTYSVPGMTKTILEHETMSDPGEAIVDMDALTPGRTDRPLMQLEGLPLPITHGDFWFSSRELGTSRNTGTPLDTTMAEAVGRRIAESIEQTTIGTVAGITYGGLSTHYGGYGRTSKVYGYTNFTSRLTKTNLTTPTGSNPEATVNDVLAMRSQLYAAKMYGPFMIYHSTDWDQFLDNDYARLGGNNASMTLRDRLRKIEDVQDVRRLDYLTSSANPYTLLMIQMTPDVVRAVNGLELTTVQWESKGGFQLNFKVLCIQVPQLRADYNGNCGILHATTS